MSQPLQISSYEDYLEYTRGKFLRAFIRYAVGEGALDEETAKNMTITEMDEYFNRSEYESNR